MSVVERLKVCPQCGSDLLPVLQSPTSPLNRDQFDAQRAGDWYCRTCPDNGRGHSRLCYWWDRELTAAHDFQI